MKREIRLSGIASLACAAALVLASCSAPEKEAGTKG